MKSISYASVRACEQTESATPRVASEPVPGESTDTGAQIFSAPEDELPDCQEWWTPADLAARLGLTPNAITYHCRRLFPEHAWRNRYRLSYEQARRIYRYVQKFGSKQNQKVGGSGPNNESLEQPPSQKP